MKSIQPNLLEMTLWHKISGILVLSLPTQFLKRTTWVSRTPVNELIIISCCHLRVKISEIWMWYHVPCFQNIYGVNVLTVYFHCMGQWRRVVHHLIISLMIIIINRKRRKLGCKLLPEKNVDVRSIIFLGVVTD